MTKQIKDFVAAQEANFPRVLQYFGRRGANSEGALGSTEELFRLAFEFWLDGGRESAQLGWLLRRAGNRANATIRPTLPLPAQDSALAQALRRLPETDRELLILIHWDGLSGAELAQVLASTNRQAVKAAGGARTRLVEQLEQLPHRELEEKSDPPGAAGQPGTPDSDAPGEYLRHGSGPLAQELLELDPLAGGTEDISLARSVLQNVIAPGSKTRAMSSRSQRTSKERRNQKPLIAVVLVASAAAITLGAGALLILPDPSSGTSTAVGTPADTQYLRQLVAKTSYGPFKRWSTFTALNKTVSFDLPPGWTVDALSSGSTFGDSGRIRAAVSNSSSVQVAVLDSGYSAFGPPVDCKKGGYELSTLDSAPVPGVPSSELGNPAGFVYRIVQDKHSGAVTASLGIVTNSFPSGAGSCIQLNLAALPAGGDRASYFSFADQQILQPVPAAAAAQGLGPSLHTFDTVDQAEWYMQSAEYQDFKRMLVSLKLVPQSTGSAGLAAGTGHR
ncbi:RNA polymerase sigma factor [Paenarthrobacter sp. Z7-10]|uniref:RNA polymerase sigma factor n=1 Tax=Paenarthrobacter sp. Z7-10 TaxID=2787635 RepID=UPI0022A9B4AC|nr:sigma factor-like helix-turn-helix DNA-binding protein [Paenarthrobacter sp. Z7-10]